MKRTAFNIISSRVYKKLEALDRRLTYHKLSHTKDVVQQSDRIARAEGISEKDIYLLKIAALYHDTGFLETYTGHEEVSCRLFLDDAKDFALTDEEKQEIVALIMATKVPQRPTSHLEMIICDADLDYLGRPDFATISEGLKQEFLTYGIVTDEAEWMRKQDEFLAVHKFHTETSRKLREPFKLQQI